MKLLARLRRAAERGGIISERVRSTKAWRPWERVLLEEYPDRATAEKREPLLEVRMGPQGTGSTFGEVAEWSNAAVLKTPQRLLKSPVYSVNLRTKTTRCEQIPR